MTQDRYLARGRVHTAVADLLDRTLVTLILLARRATDMTDDLDITELERQLFPKPVGTWTPDDWGNVLRDRAETR